MWQTFHYFLALYDGLFDIRINFIEASHDCLSIVCLKILLHTRYYDVH